MQSIKEYIAIIKKIDNIKPWLHNINSVFDSNSFPMTTHPVSDHSIPNWQDGPMRRLISMLTNTL